MKGKVKVGRLIFKITIEVRVSVEWTLPVVGSAKITIEIVSVQLGWSWRWSAGLSRLMSRPECGCRDNLNLGKSRHCHSQGNEVWMGSQRC